MKNNTNLAPRAKSSAFENLALEGQSDENNKQLPEVLMRVVDPQNDTSLQAVLEIRGKLEDLDGIM